MAKMPNAQLGQLISVSGNQAVISDIHPSRKNTVEITYLLAGYKPTYEYARWMDGKWHFASGGQIGNYASDVPRLRKYLLMLPGFHPRKISTVPKKGPDRRHALKPRPRSLGSRR